MVDIFNDSHTNIFVHAIPDKTSDALMTAIAGGNPPDINISWDATESAQWPAGGLIIDVDEIARAAGIDDSIFVSAAIEACKLNGKEYFGIHSESGRIIYNRCAGLNALRYPFFCHFRRGGTKQYDSLA